MFKKNELSNVLWINIEDTLTAKLFESKFKSLPYNIKGRIANFNVYTYSKWFLKSNYELSQVNDKHSYDSRLSHYNIEFIISEVVEQNIFYKGLKEFHNLLTSIKKSKSVTNFKNYLQDV